jgi:hypothetical protein
MVNQDETTLTCMRLRRGWLKLGLAACNERERPLVEEAIGYRNREIERFENRLRGQAAGAPAR